MVAPIRLSRVRSSRYASSSPGLRGPVMGIWTMVLPGLVPVTAVIQGALTQFVGPRVGYGIAGVLLSVAALVGWRALADRPPE